MLKKTITFEDLDGNKVTDDFYFNLTKAELIELETSAKGGLAESLMKLIKEEDIQKVIEYFKKIILMAYGIRSEDGRRFIKSQELRDAFEQTDAYSELFIELATQADAGAAFVNGIVPKSIFEALEDAEKKADKPIGEMTREELIAAFQKQAQ